MYNLSHKGTTCGQTCCNGFLERLQNAMLTGRISIVGSTNRGDAQTQADARVAAYHLGRAFAKAGLPILVYYDDSIFIEAEVVRGYLESGSAAVNSIEVRYPEKVDENNVPNPPPFAKYQGHPSFVFHPDKNPEWEISFYRSLDEIGGMLVLQGGSSTLIAGLISIGANKPVLVCSGCGGTAVKLSSILAERGAITPTEKALLQARPEPAGVQKWAETCVALLLKQADAIEAKRREQAAKAESARKRRNQQTITAAVFVVTALVLCILNWDNSLKLSPLGVRAVLFVVAGLSGALGAMLWSTLPFLRPKTQEEPDSVWGTCALGLIIGCLSALIYLVAQEHGFPELRGFVDEKKISISELHADYLAKLIPSVMITALAAGMTLDRAFKALIKHKAVD
jgi:hypothetical protein